MVVERMRKALAAAIPSSRGLRLGVACSGGADSTALLLGLLALRAELGFELAVVHLNHQLRGEGSAADEAFVRELAEREGLPAHVGAVDVAALATASGIGLEEAGRRARYDFFGELIDGGVCDRVATGHTLSDQAETVLFRLVRGSGLRGLRGVQPQRAPGVVRPLLDVRADEVRAYLRARGERWREDPSNADRAFRRNRIRLDVGPQLADLNPRWQEALARTAAQAREEEAYWEQATAQAAERLFQRRAGGLRISVGGFLAEHVAQQRRLLRLACEQVAGRTDWEGVEALLRLFEPGRGTGRATLPGLSAQRSFDAVLLRPAETETPVSPAVVCGRPPVELDAPDGCSRVRLEIASQHIASGRYTEPIWSGLDWNRPDEPLVLRPWRAGDRWRSRKSGREKKMKDLLQQARVEIWDRSNWPVLAAGDEVVWTRGFGVSAGRQASADSSRILAIREVDQDGREIRGIEQWRQTVYRV